MKRCYPWLLLLGTVALRCASPSSQPNPTGLPASQPSAPIENTSPTSDHWKQFVPQGYQVMVSAEEPLVITALLDNDQEPDHAMVLEQIGAHPPVAKILVAYGKPQPGAPPTEMSGNLGPDPSEFADLVDLTLDQGRLVYHHETHMWSGDFAFIWDPALKRLVLVTAESYMAPPNDQLEAIHAVSDFRNGKRIAEDAGKTQQTTLSTHTRLLSTLDEDSLYAYY